MFKNLSIVLVAMFLIGTASTVSAHGVLSSQTKEVDKYTIEFQATADATAVYTGYPISYRFRLLNTKSQEEVAFDSAYVTFAKKGDEYEGLVFAAQLDNNSFFAAGMSLDVAISDPGDYVAEVSFQKDDATEGSKEITKANFELKAVEGETSSTGTASETNKTNTGADSSRYILGVIALIIGAVLGRVSNRLFKSTFR